MARELFKGVVGGCRASLSKAITMVESSRHAETKRELVRLTNDHLVGNRIESTRVAISGSPGCGKSSFIESMGMKLVEEGRRRLAVLAVDPSSSVTGGSLLADKTRMTMLSRHPNAYIRPSPNQGQLGGITRSTGESILLCEAAGYDLIMVETVGVGQSEYIVNDLCDVFALLVAPSGGDEIQAIKKGIVELANIVVVTKSDGDLVKHARKMSAEFISATKFMNIGVKPKVRRCSSHSREGLDEVWADIELLCSDLRLKHEGRRRKRAHLLRTYLVEAILDRLHTQVDLKQYESKLLVDDSLLLWDVVDDILGKI